MINRAVLVSLVSLIGLSILSLPIHELGHYMTASMMGYGGSIDLYWHNLSGLYTYGFIPSVVDSQIIGLAGGLTVATIYLIASIFTVKIRPFLYIIAFVQLGYALTEAGCPDVCVFIGCVAGFLMGIMSLNKAVESYVREY